MGGGEPLERAVLAGLSLLRELPRERSATDDARRRFADFAKTHAKVTSDFVVDLGPGREKASYDILLDHPDGGTVALSWRPDSASPWLAEYAEHWAANYVVSIGDAHLTVQDALTSLRVLGGEDAGILDRLIEDAIIRKAILDRRVDSTPDEVQDAMDETRQSLGLHSAAATHAWLSEMGWSEHEFGSLVAGGVRVRKLREAIVDNRVDAHFAAHRASFDIVRVCQAETRSQETAERLAAAGGLIAAVERLSPAEAAQVEMTVRSLRGVELPADLRDLSAGDVAGPSRAGDRFQVAQLLERRQAELDAATRVAVGDSLFRDWLAEQRRSGPVRWHWL